MAYRAFGSTGIEVSAIGFGAWQLGRSAEWPTGPAPDEAVRLVHAALDAGVTFIDTAPGYAGGQSEANIGSALRGGRRDGVVLCTKVGHSPDGGTDWSADAVEPSILRSARAMGVDRIDVVVLHNPPPEVLAGDGGHYDVLARLRDRGLVRAFGTSVDTGSDVDATPAGDAVEVRLSALYQEPWEAVARAGDRGAGVIVKVPLESGWLSGRYGPDAVFTDVRGRWSADDVAVRARLVDELRGLLPAGVALPGAALRFLLAHDAVSTVIPGTRSLEHLHASVAAAAAGPLDAETVAAVRAWYADRLGAAPLDW